ncbi:amidohydrolase family protein [Gemmatimonadota bacterium]
MKIFRDIFSGVPVCYLTSATLVAIFLLVVTCAEMNGADASDATAEGKTQSSAGMTVGELKKMKKIDAHAHIWEYADTVAEVDGFGTWLDGHNMKWLDICVFVTSYGGAEIEGHDGLILQHKLGYKFNTAYPDKSTWTASFSLKDFGSKNWTQDVISMLEDCFAKGAVGVKLWKDIGMTLREPGDPDSSFVLVDDPRFTPVFDYIEKCNKTLVTHIAEPLNCWLPLDSMTIDGDAEYFRDHPDHHGYLHPEMPDFWALMETQNNLLARHPNLRVVGTHLGSLDYDVDAIAAAFDKYPNYAVDIAFRVEHLMVQDREKVRNFMIKYADRLLFGTDNILGRNDIPLAEELKGFDFFYDYQYRYFATDEEVASDIAKPGFSCQGLALPADVLKKFYYENALKWYPGI